ncbi:MAG: ABC transporter ATP-binding protein [Bacteroidia bacterium]|nr:MAG: ABC transporter ATP-binding protein [Bacteroidia bacterium]
MEQPIVECKNLTHYYGKRCIYENLNFSIPKGRILGLLGKNGTGKTTTINILNGYLKPKSGKCLMFGENASNLSPETKQKVGLLIEGHVQYSFFNISEIERFYSAFYPKWKKEAYYELMQLLKIDPKQKIARMSCGQRSQVALGLILAQDYLSEYARSENKTVFVTSHIIQDMERLIDDCLIMDYGRIILQMPIKELMAKFYRYRFSTENPQQLAAISELINTNTIKGNTETYAMLSETEMKNLLQQNNISVNGFLQEQLTLEEAFIGLTGKY